MGRGAPRSEPARHQTWSPANGCRPVQILCRHAGCAPAGCTPSGEDTQVREQGKERQLFGYTVADGAGTGTRAAQVRLRSSSQQGRPSSARSRSRRTCRTRPYALFPVRSCLPILWLPGSTLDRPGVRSRVTAVYAHGRRRLAGLGLGASAVRGRGCGQGTRMGEQRSSAVDRVAERRVRRGRAFEDEASRPCER